MEKHETEIDLRPAGLTDGQGAVPFDPDEGRVVYKSNSYRL